MEKTVIVKEWLKGHSRKYLEELKYEIIKNKVEYCRINTRDKKKLAKKLVNEELLKYYREEMMRW